MNAVAPLGSSHNASYLIMLDLVRFLSAALVVGLHLGFWAWWKQGDDIGTIARLFPGYPEFPELIPFTWFGWVGVQIFFVISGYVIAMSAEKSTILRFLRSRFLRLYPVAWICSTVSLVVIVVATNHDLGSSIFLRYLNTLIISPYPKWIDGVYWTLALELVFYGLVFMIIAMGRRKDVIGFGIVLGCVSTFYIAGIASDFLAGGWLFTLLLLRHGVFFAIGMLIWGMGGGRRPIQWRNIAFLIGFTVMGTIEILHTAVTKLDALNLAAPMHAPVVAWLVMLSCIFASATWPDVFNRWLFPARHILRLLGLATYPLYLVHQTVGGAMGAFAVNAGLGRYMALLLAISTCIAASIAIATLLEPFIRRFAADRFDAVAASLPTMKIFSRHKNR